MSNREFSNEERAHIAARISEVFSKLERGIPAQISKHLEISYQAVSKWPRSGMIGIKGLFYLSSLSGYNPYWIMFGKGSKYVEPPIEYSKKLSTFSDDELTYEINKRMSPKFLKLLLNIDDDSVAWVIYMLLKINKTTQDTIIKDCIHDLQVMQERGAKNSKQSLEANKNLT